MSIKTQSLRSQFPDDFLWGASTSAHQVEGGNHNDWSEWETTNAAKMAAEAEGRYAHWLRNWDKIKEQARDPQNYISGKASNHYELFKEDIELMKRVGLNSYRFSIEWSRIQPSPDEFDQREINHYREVISALREAGIEPLVTLWHWTVPTWFRDMGGWLNPNSADYFAKFVEHAVGCCLEVKYWITLNEPTVYARQSYLVGDWPPQKRNYFQHLMVLRNLAMAHQLAYTIVKRKYPQAQIGVAHHMTYIEPYPNNILNRVFAKIGNWWTNTMFLNQIHDHLDFIGVNYYFHSQFSLTPYLSHSTHDYPESDLGWELYPDGLYHVLVSLRNYEKPIFITEHGLADAKDEYRVWYITESLNRAKMAIDHGVDLRGYFHWSLLDNFEWDKGFWPRFGLIEVDFKTQARRIRDSVRIIMPDNS